MKKYQSSYVFKQIKKIRICEKKIQTEFLSRQNFCPDRISVQTEFLSNLTPLLNPDYTASVVEDTNQVNQAGQFQGLYREHDLQGRFEFVLVFLPVKVCVPNKI